MSFLNLNLPETNLNSSSSSSSLSNPDHRIFSCNYCRRKFYSSQALGGHQNAHRIERNLAKKNRELTSVVKTHSGYNGPTVSSGSSHGRYVQPTVVMGFNHQEHVGRFSGSEMGRVLDYSYKGENVDQEDFNHLDLSLRL